MSDFPKRKKKNKKMSKGSWVESSQIFNEIDLHFRIINAMNALNFYFTHSQMYGEKKNYKLYVIFLGV